ncbi:hypothetical protein B0H16DRAFT_1466133 [Mycena metata]|uniref:Uncharacterized protein n=1 Tax=Mycena metata TaxID=1033252 RepID=A0AAD7IAH1_9AGAR|nr:hypothetical protein B0H16DRAFT_1466133 [Mycena metata]
MLMCTRRVNEVNAGFEWGPVRVSGNGENQVYLIVSLFAGSASPSPSKPKPKPAKPVQPNLNSAKRGKPVRKVSSQGDEIKKSSEPRNERAYLDFSPRKTPALASHFHREKIEMKIEQPVGDRNRNVTWPWNSFSKRKKIG